MTVSTEELLDLNLQIAAKELELEVQKELEIQVVPVSEPDHVETLAEHKEAHGCTGDPFCTLRPEPPAPVFQPKNRYTMLNCFAPD